MSFKVTVMAGDSAGTSCVLWERASKLWNLRGSTEMMRFIFQQAA